MVYYNIFSGLVNNNSLCLDIQNSNGVNYIIIRTFDPSSYTQQWLPVFLISGQLLGGIALMNRESGQYIYAAGTESGSALATMVFNGSDWQNYPVAFTPAGNGIIQLTQNQGMNMAVLGGIAKSGTTVNLLNYDKKPNPSQSFFWQLVQ